MSLQCAGSAEKSPWRGEGLNPLEAGGAEPLGGGRGRTPAEGGGGLDSSEREGWRPASQGQNSIQMSGLSRILLPHECAQLFESGRDFGILTGRSFGISNSFKYSNENKVRPNSTNKKN